MPLWPFLMLVTIFIVVLVLPPLLAAWVDYRNEERRRQPAGYDPSAMGRRAEANGSSAAGDRRYTLNPTAGAGPVQQDPGGLSHPLPPEEIIDPGEADGKGANRDPVAGYSARDSEADGQAKTRRREK